MIVTEHFDLISIYRSQNEKEEILQHLLKLIDLDRPTIILGDINLDLLKKCHHPMLQYLESQGFIQLVKSTGRLVGSSLYQSSF